jgi:nucleotide-binding universal stress UspA family protein
LPAGLARIEVVVAPNAAVAILEQAHHEEFDLIAMATHGRRGLARVLVGSVADKVLRGATTPVLLYRAPAH